MYDGLASSNLGSEPDFLQTPKLLVKVGNLSKRQDIRISDDFY